MSLFTPRNGDDLTVTLPSETMRARVTRVIDADTVIVEIGQPFMKTHSYRAGDLVGCRRTAGLLGETWQAIEVRPALPDFALAPPAAHLPPENDKKLQKTAQKTPKPVQTGRLARQPKGPNP